MRLPIISYFTIEGRRGVYLPLPQPVIVTSILSSLTDRPDEILNHAILRATFRGKLYIASHEQLFNEIQWMTGKY